MDQNQMPAPTMLVEGNLIAKKSYWLGWLGSVFYLIVVIGFILLSSIDPIEIILVAILSSVLLGAYWAVVLAGAIILNVPNRTARKALTVLGTMFGLLGITEIIDYWISNKILWLELAREQSSNVNLLISLSYFIIPLFVTLVVTKSIYNIKWWTSLFIVLLASIVYYFLSSFGLTLVFPQG